MGRLENKTAVITGAATGIGQATAEVFANEGARVMIGDINEDQMKETVEAIRQNGGQADAFHLDVSDENSVKAFADQIKEACGTIDILFNNAGVDQEGGKVHEYPVDLFDRIIAVDLRGTFLCSKYLIPLMLEKGGITNLTKAMAIDYARDGIRVNSISPGTIETPLIDKLAGTKEQEMGEKFREANKWVTPLGRLGQPKEMATVALFLASDDSSYVTGEDITADGGIMAYTWPGKMLLDEKWKEETK
ncbi:SDR family oxidoreductase [Bacillus subtilis]|uniref:SDR family oxidoreductase n=1 Tax=Bacillus subtilis TaxID=1423 RepID=A0A8I1WG49_BACIU|nr:SDR family oxidoreductase [Bacillus subtilis]MBO3794092.1 SDR family oxidoreductase [Bacillus subtilis]